MKIISGLQLKEIKLEKELANGGCAKHFFLMIHLSPDFLRIISLRVIEFAYFPMVFAAFFSICRMGS